jgi:hypothetical protein
MISKHPRFLLVAAANTWGQGPTAEYIGRSRQDAAFLKRFSRIAWEYDERLETAASGNVEWAKKVQKFRRAAEKRKLRIIITPRDSIMGARLLAAGFTEEQVVDMTILAGVAEDTREALLEATRG